MKISLPRFVVGPTEGHTGFLRKGDGSCIIIFSLQASWKENASTHWDEQCHTLLLEYWQSYILSGMNLVQWGRVVVARAVLKKRSCTRACH